jgi:hypothetical protein
MSHVTLILSALFTMAMVVVMAPGVLALNRGRILRNTALWLALFLGLALIYRTVGPDSPHPLFRLPVAMQGMNGDGQDDASAPASSETKDGKKDDGADGYTPPKE